MMGQYKVILYSGEVINLILEDFGSDFGLESISENEIIRFPRKKIPLGCIFLFWPF